MLNLCDMVRDLKIPSKRVENWVNRDLFNCVRRGHGIPAQIPDSDADHATAWLMLANIFSPQIARYLTAKMGSVEEPWIVIPTEGAHALDIIGTTDPRSVILSIKSTGYITIDNERRKQAGRVEKTA